jgi:hypothetical protein
VVLALQAGHGPGWQSSTQVWTQSGVPPVLKADSVLAQTSPQECGVSRRFHSGSRCRPQKQRYSRGTDRDTRWQPGQRQPPSSEKGRGKCLSYFCVGYIDGNHG